jgi:hypothetical protein
MKKEIQITVPSNYKAITLRKYLELHKDLELYKEDHEATTAALFYHLCGMTPEIVNAIDTETYNKIKEELFSFLSNNEYPLYRTFKIGDVEYGFEPNLSQMAYGAYLDISKYNELTINEDWAKVMSILYRKVSSKQGALYDIEPYTGREDHTIFYNVDMEVHFGALFFFINLSKDLLKDTLNSLKDHPEIPHNIKSILERSGEDILQ